METDKNNVLYQKIGVTINSLALSFLSKNEGERIASITQYQEELGVSRGTIQNALNYLKDVHAIQLVSRGHLGTYIEHIDYIKLQECSLVRGLMGIMPFPYSSAYEGFATALYEQLKNFRFNMAYARGARGRMELVESGAYQFAVCSQYSAQHEIKNGRNIEIALNFGAGSFLSRHVLLLKDTEKNGLEDGMRVAYDKESLDQSQITKSVVGKRKVELVNIRTQQTVNALQDGVIDAGVWNYDDILENHYMDNLKVVFLQKEEYEESFSAAVLVVKRNSRYLQQILEKNISVKETLKIQDEVRKGKRRSIC